MSARIALERLIARTLEFHWLHGDCTRIGAHTTGWRDSPNAGMVQIHHLRTKIELPGQKPRWAEPGEAVLLQAQCHHCLTSTETGGAGLCRWASCDWLILGGIHVLSLFDVPMVHQGRVAQRIGDACERLAALANPPLPGDPIRPVVERTALGLGVLTELVEGRPLQPHALALLTHAERLQPVLATIDAQLGSPLDRAALARLAGLSPSRFHDLFVTVLRQAPMAYVTRRRMQRAQQLLLTTGQSVQAIAAQLGYDDPFHFSRAFRRTTGQSPRGYRQQGQAWLVPGGPATALTPA